MLLNHLQIVSKLKRLYKNVDDVDLFIGGITENPYPGSLLGPTFTCLIADQFVRLRKGDRFTYDIGGQSHSFTEGNVTLHCLIIRFFHLY
jgi:peroxidase